ncbi:MAG: SsrA-binding protein SmpB [Rhodospirillaceae bacterium]|jgi:SsrA-binding protein|nr:SsrA-binding protein SmpB [Rhodospirillaceae bacterium]MBT3910804.1 SsrA-binding protein SmpB [Rhodospirillaceae bacterium]MBT5299302.1 SsrA-binding protein SmpB [Rhodospirillaceae bacterium]MBT5516180.1 SsrA-binding protein SmpB [Rhodospirillaceae bacterium]MBT6087533.1 SsrA-binding protein SmpB [Rhodospirillaceae bacterium]
MARKKTKKSDGNIAAQNRKARHDYHIVETLEAGVMLSGSEVKSLRGGRASIGEAYAEVRDGEMFLKNAYIPEYDGAHVVTHKPRGDRKLLLHRREIAKLWDATQRKGMTVVPLKVYFNERGIAKVEIAIAEGKKHYDKRQSQKERDWGRQKQRLMRDLG